MRGHEENTTFLGRFDAARGAVIRMQVARGVLWGVFAAGTAIVALAVADYLLELPWQTRAKWLTAGVALAAFVAAWGILKPVLWWSRPKTAQELETLFPQLGQRVRTVVQFAGRDPQSITQEGVKPDLVAALEDETSSRAEPLDLRALVPWRPTAVAAAIAAVPFVLLMVGFLFDWQWRLAISRVLLGNGPYTTIAVKPGDATVDEGQDLALTLTVQGRVDRSVSLVTKKYGEREEGPTAEQLDPDSIAHRSADGRSLEYSVAMAEVTDPFDYRFLAGDLESATHHVSIRRPLDLTRFDATLTPPAYTGLPKTTVEGGDLLAIEDTEIAFAVQFDRPCREAYLMVSDPPFTKKESGTPERIDFQPGDDSLVATLQLRDDKMYSLVASAKDGLPLPENEYRIRIRKDRAPHVRFEDPPEAWEVNPLAEVPMRIRVDDDFGVSKAGIVFQIDNGKENELVTAKYSTSVEPDADGKIALTTRAALEKLLNLEDFPVTETSAVTYYAYVEDNFPAKPKQAMTDLRFMEIRPFARFFRLGGTCQCNGRCMTLEELIARQRVLLIRTTRIARAGGSAVPDQPTIDEMIRSQTTLADVAASFAEGLEALADFRCEFLDGAQAEMRKSIDQLGEKKFSPAAEHQAEAVALLVKARSVLRKVFGESMSASAAQKFDREQMQKLRKPLTEEEEAEQIAQKLEELAKEERIVYETLGGAPCEACNPSEAPSGESTSRSASSRDEPKGSTDEEKADEEASASAGDKEAQDGSKEDSSEGTPGGQAQGQKSAEGRKAGHSGDDQGDREGQGDSGKSIDRKELERRQYEIVLDAYQIQKVLESLEGITELAEDRMSRSIEQAERVSDALPRGDADEARDAAGEASRTFKELARHVAGLTARDLAAKIGAARDLAADLAQEHRDLAERLDRDTPPVPSSQQAAKSGSSDEKQGGRQSSSMESTGSQDAEQVGHGGEGDGEDQSGQPGGGNREGERGGEGGRGEASSEIVEAGRTLKDLLDALGQDGDLDSELATKLAAALENADLAAILREIEAVAEALRDARRSGLPVDVRDVAERLDVLSGTLDALHGAVVAPRLAELIELEAQVARLRERLETLTSDAEISKWHLDAQELMETLERAEAGAKAVEDLRQGMEAAGWGADRTSWGWDYVHDNRLGLSRYTAPVAYATNLILLEKAIQQEAKELLLRDMVSSADNAVPPEYEKLVERYFDVLSREKQAER